jgi:hypothetical protein
MKLSLLPKCANHYQGPKGLRTTWPQGHKVPGPQGGPHIEDTSLYELMHGTERLLRLLMPRSFEEIEGQIIVVAQSSPRSEGSALIQTVEVDDEQQRHQSGGSPEYVTHSRSLG